MQRRTFLAGLSASALLPGVAWGSELPSVDALLEAVDGNLTYSTRVARVKMTVVTTRRTRLYEMRTWGRGADEAAIEYMAPARDKGTRMLRKGSELWMYLPSIEKVQKISGHMLRQGMMGSDVSYEDLLGASKWRDAYEAAVTAEETREGRKVWKVELTAKDDSIAYPRRVAWIDAETRIPVHQELYALSGMLLKTWEMSDISEIGGRNFPKTMVIKDEVKKGSSTTIEMTELDFGATLDEEVFAMRWLERR
jgi:outer membrane lipoprotein-sorting protein